MKAFAKQSGFSLALTMMVTVVLILLAGSVIANILNTLRGVTITRQQAGLTNEADLGLKMAESEIDQNLDLMLYTMWSAAASPSMLQSTNATGALDAEGKFPVRDLELLGNARNWPPFCDWAFYIQHYNNGFTEQATQSGPSSLDPPPAGWTIPYTILEQDATPSPIFNENDPCLTRGWWKVPRDSRPDDDYYTDTNGSGTYGCAGGITPNLPPAFPVTSQGATSTDEMTPVSYKDLVSGLSTTVMALPHSYWYKDVLPICGQITATSSLLSFSAWPDAPMGWVNHSGETLYQTGEYGNGTCGGAHYGYTGQDPGSAGFTGKPQALDTPVYKKVYTLQNGRRVAVYCRLDLRDYFPPDKSAPPDYQWPFENALPSQTTEGPFDPTNYIRFFLAAVPEGRFDAIGGGQVEYRPAQMSYKWIYLAVGGAEHNELATSSDPLVLAAGLPDDHHFPGTLMTSGGLLQKGVDLIGQIFRGDGNLGFNWTSYA
ncbi:MAG: type II secretion system GspH family protein, partial [Cyanobacteria bacterium REEB65]|nr:type II secretion system GspH family protein [Cyanobacteria bacterium REEB65]